MFQSMLRAGLLEKVPDPGGGALLVLRITSARLEAIGTKPSPAETPREVAADPREGVAGQGSTTASLNAQEPSVVPSAPSQFRTTLRSVASALLVV